MLDTVQRWTAPYDGNIVIDVSFLAASVNAAPSPSIRAAVQINQAEQWAVVLGDEAQSKILSATVTGTLLIGIYFSNFTNQAGDRVYFRSGTTANGGGGAVNFTATITYPHLTNVIDSNNINVSYLNHNIYN